MSNQEGRVEIMILTVKPDGTAPRFQVRDGYHDKEFIAVVPRKEDSLSDTLANAMARAEKVADRMKKGRREKLQKLAEDALLEIDSLDKDDFDH